MTPPGHFVSINERTRGTRSTACLGFASSPGRAGDARTLAGPGRRAAGAALSAGAAARLGVAGAGGDRHVTAALADASTGRCLDRLRLGLPLRPGRPRRPARPGAGRYYPLAAGAGGRPAATGGRRGALRTGSHHQRRAAPARAAAGVLVRRAGGPQRRDLALGCHPPAPAWPGESPHLRLRGLAAGPAYRRHRDGEGGRTAHGGRRAWRLA